MYRRFLCSVLAFLLWIGALAGCQSSLPIRIGLAVELTGRRSELGVAVRNGAELAVDAINAAGGVNGRPLELVTRDDQGVPEMARQVDQDLAEAGVVAIIGHITSEQTAAVFEQTNQAQIVMLSPTSSSSLFTGKDDYFFRVMPSSEFLAQSLAQHVFQNNSVRQVVGIYDLNNRSFSETFWMAFQAEFTALGGDARQGLTFRSGKSDLQAQITVVKAQGPQAVLFIASAVDTALMAQYARQQELSARLYSSTWAQTKELLEKGGQAIEGMELSASFNPAYPSPEYKQFELEYEQRFGGPPILGSAHAYESVLVLAQALEQTGGRAEGLREALKQVHGLDGLQGKITFDAYGDVQREVFFMRVEGGEFVIQK